MVEETGKLNIKDAVKFVLRIGSAQNKGGQISLFSNFLYTVAYNDLRA